MHLRLSQFMVLVGALVILAATPSFAQTLESTSTTFPEWQVVEAVDGSGCSSGEFLEDDNIVWGTVLAQPSCSTSADDNIVWGTIFDEDNVVWGTRLADGNIVWGTRQDEDSIVWGTGLTPHDGFEF